MIAVDNRHRNQGLGRILLADALERAVSVSDQVGLKAVVLDVIEDGGQEIKKRRYEFHTAMGFRPLPSRPSRMFIGIDTIRQGMR